MSNDCVWWGDKVGCQIMLSRTFLLQQLHQFWQDCHGQVAQSCWLWRVDPHLNAALFAVLERLCRCCLFQCPCCLWIFPFVRWAEPGWELYISRSWHSGYELIRTTISVLGDINTGKSYLKTYDLLIKKPEDMLLPCVFAIDKTICDIGGEALNLS